MRLRYLVALVTIVAMSLAPAAGGWAKHPSLNEVASWLAGKPVKVRCLDAFESSRDVLISFWGASAYVEFETDGFGHRLGPKDYTVVAHPICDDLLSHEGPPTQEYVWAVFVIVHESGHLRGKSFPLWFDEGSVNCWALRRSAAVAQIKFGLDPLEVPEFNRIIWRIYLGQPDEYNRSECKLPPA